MMLQRAGSCSLRVRRFGFPADQSLRIEKHGKNAARLASGRGQPELVEHTGNVLLHGALGDHQPFGDSGVGVAGGHQFENLTFAGGEPVQWVTPPAPEQRRDDLRIDRGSTAGDTPHRVHELADIANAIFEQVSHLLRRLRQQLQGQAQLHILRQDQDRGAGMIPADAQGRPHALVGVRGRQPDVDDHDVWRLNADQVEQVVGIVVRRGDM